MNQEIRDFTPGGRPETTTQTSGYAAVDWTKSEPYQRHFVNNEEVSDVKAALALIERLYVRTFVLDTQTQASLKTDIEVLRSEVGSLRRTVEGLSEYVTVLHTKLNNATAPAPQTNFPYVPPLHVPNPAYPFSPDTPFDITCKTNVGVRFTD